MNTKILSWGAIFYVVTSSSPAYAAVTTLSGGVSTGYEYFDRTRDDSEASSSSSGNDDTYSRFRISPFVTIASETPRQSVDFKYAPSFWYDLDESEDNVDHNLSLDYMRMLTRYWNITLADDLSVTDAFNSFAPTTDPETGDIISDSPGADASGDVLRDERGRRRYTHNSARLGTEYTYLEDSTAALDYSLDTLRNEQDFSGSNYQDYDKHDVSFALAHRLTSRWKATAVAGYIRGLYDSVDGSTNDISADSDDVSEYRASLLVDHSLSPQHSLNGLYGYNQSDYDSDLRHDSEIHDVTFGWEWDVSPKLNLTMGAGPTYTKQEEASGDWGSNANFGIKYRMEKGNFGLTGSHGTSFNNFSGTDERGNSEFWKLQANIHYSIFQYTSVSAYTGYLNEDRDETAQSGLPATETVNTKNYSAGCGISHRFHEKYVADLSYGYVHHTSDNAENDYDDHRIAMTISYENDFLQW